MAKSNYEGMGANYIKDKNLTSFRVWAKFAESVKVVGNFNGWDENTAISLENEGNDYWSVDVPNIGIDTQYKFILVNKDTKATLWKNDPYARRLIQDGDNSNSVVAEPETEYKWATDDYQMPHWHELVIYELHVGTFFYEPDSPIKRGTFTSLISRLDHLRDLGINAIEILPAGEFDGVTSQGYNPTYMFAIENDYGGPNNFRKFVDEAHKRGIAIIFDVVYNHFSTSGLDMWEFDGWYTDKGGGIYVYNHEPNNHTAFGSRPDYGRGEVRQYLRDNALRWLENRRVDGLRWDSTVNIRNAYGTNGPYGDIPEGWSLMQWINDEIKNRQPWKINIAEDLQGNEWLSKTTGAGGAGFNAQWDAEFVGSLRSVLTTPYDSDRDMDTVSRILTRTYNGNALERVIYTESHDEVDTKYGHGRIPALIPDNANGRYAQKRSTLGAAITFTAPGIPMIFQGQEFLEYEPFKDDTPLNWEHFNPGIFKLYRDLIRLRRNWYNQTAGLRGQHINVHHVDNGNKLIAYHRWENGGAGDDVVIVANFSNQRYDSYTIGFPREGLWKLRFNSDWNGYSDKFDNQPGYDTNAYDGAYDGMAYSGNVGVGAYSVVIYSQDR